MQEIGPVTLDGEWVRLAPLERGHGAALATIAADKEVWRYLPASLATPADLDAWLGKALDNAAAGMELPFVTIEKATGALVGATRLMDIKRQHRTVEIGNTWLGRAWWRSTINSEAKYLLLRHIFDTLGYQRACFKTDLLNERSQRAIERLGSVREGVLRKHMIVQDGRARDTVYYSIVDDEWPAVRARMEMRLYGAAGGAHDRGDQDGAHGE